MSINLRIYADQIYGFAQSYMKEYISPEIIKEEFINNFKSGKLNYENISTKKEIKINPQINLEELSIQNFEINIPNETENLSLSIGNLKGICNLKEINDDEIEKIILAERKDLIEGFMNFVIKKIEKKDESKTFIEGLMETFINRAINGLTINLNNIELIIKFKKHIICLDIEKFSYSEEKGIKIENFSISSMEEGNKKDILKKFSVTIELNKKKEFIEKKEEKEEKEENKENNDINNNVKEENNLENKQQFENENKNKLNILITNIEFEISQNIIYAFNDFYELFNVSEYKKIFLRYKKLIQYHKPKISEDKKNNYISLWFYAIKTVIKLQKYIGRKKHYIFDLIESSQIKIIKKYLNDNNSINNIILPNEICSLKATKDKVEQKLLENKKGGGLTKAFSFFFGGGGDDDNKELTEDEKKELNEIYTDEYIIKYLLGFNEGKKRKNNPFSEKINKIVNDLIINFQIDKIEVKENNYNCNFFIKTIKINSNIINKQFDLEINIDDIGTLLNESLFSDKFEDVKYLIQIKKDKNSDKINLNLGFNNIVLNEDMFIFFISYFSTLKKNSNILKLFQKTDYYQMINKEIKENKGEEINEVKKEENENNIQIFENFYISNIPSLTLLNQDKNKLEINIKNFIFDKTKLSFSLNILDSFGTILDNYDFNFNVEKNEKKQKYILNLEQALNIIISKDTSFFIFLTYLKLKDIPNNIKNQKENNINNNSEINEEIYKLFCFNYIEHKEVNIDFNNYNVDFLINELNIELNEKKCSSYIFLKNFNIKYENKNLLLNIEKVEGNVDYLSDIILYMLDFKSKDFDQYEKIIAKNRNNVDNENNPKNNDINFQNMPNNITTNYNIKISDVLTNLNLEIGIIIFGIKIEENIINAKINKINGKNNLNELDIINFGINNICLYVEKKNNLNEKYNILDLNKLTTIDYNLKTELIKVKIDSPLLSVFIPIFSSILSNLAYLSEQIDWTVIICKMQMEIFNGTCKINIFNILINYLYISNFDGKTTDTFFLTIKDFLTKNEKNMNILEQKELSMNFTMKSKTEDYLCIKLKDLKTNISQHDIKYFSDLLEPNKEENKNDIKDIDIKNKNFSNEVKEENEHCLIFDGDMNNINIGLCLDDYTKKSDLNLNNLNIKLKNGKIKNLEKNLLQDIFDYKIILDRISLKYYDENKNEIIILHYFKELKKNIKTVLLNENINQVELISENNITSMNLNKNNINIRIDCFLYLYDFITKLMPQSKALNKNNQNNFIDKLKAKNEEENNFINNLNIQINLNKTKFQIQTSLDGNENLYLNIDNLLASYNLKDNIKIQIDYISSSFISQKQSRELFHTNKDFLLLKCLIKKNKTLDIESNFGTITINISYQDIISFLQCYLLNKILIQNINSIIKTFFK